MNLHFQIAYIHSTINPMKYTLILTALLWIGVFTARAQYVTCQSMPLAHSTTPVQFISMGSDSLLLIPITNNSGTNFAYPQGKLIPVTPLPAGMNFAGGSAGWVVFGSSWNDGQTNDCGFFFTVSSPIPADYMFGFTLRVKNFLPLSIDSCYFSDTITVNLNPAASGVYDLTKRVSSVDVFPNPSHDNVNIVSQAVSIHEICLSDLTGKKNYSIRVNTNAAGIPTLDLHEGIYICCIRLANGEETWRKIVVKH
jgi:hypothetical protein